MKKRESESSGFIGRLESLRGIAALWVAVGHSMIWLSLGPVGRKWSASDYEMLGSQALFRKCLLLAFNGNAAVIVFFVLSGFVLSKSLIASRIGPFSYLGYALKRAFRIFPALWFSLAVVCLYLKIAYPGHEDLLGASSWFEDWYRTQPDRPTIIDNATLVSPWLNPNAWTLKVEMIASLLLPLIVVCIGRRGITRTALVLAAFIGVGWVHRGEQLNAMHFLYLFAAGCAIAKHGSSALHLLTKYKEAVSLACIVLILASNRFLVAHGIAYDSAVGLASVGLIWSIAGGIKAKSLSILDSRWAAFLGRISYSFYLLHFIVLYATANALLHIVPSAYLIRFPVWVMAAGGVFSIAVAVLLAWLSFAAIEKPFVSVARKLASFLPSVLTRNRATRQVSTGQAE